MIRIFYDRVRGHFFDALTWEADRVTIRDVIGNMKNNLETAIKAEIGADDGREISDISSSTGRSI